MVHMDNHLKTSTIATFVKATLKLHIPVNLNTPKRSHRQHQGHKPETISQTTLIKSKGLVLNNARWQVLLSKNVTASARCRL